jgi:hypothetical protein
MLRDAAVEHERALDIPKLPIHRQVRRADASACPFLACEQEQLGVKSARTEADTCDMVGASD